MFSMFLARAPVQSRAPAQKAKAKLKTHFFQDVEHYIQLYCSPVPACLAQASGGVGGMGASGGAWLLLTALLVGLVDDVRAELTIPTTAVHVVGAALRAVSLRGRAALRHIAMQRLGLTVNSTLAEQQRRQLEEEEGMDLSIIMLLSIFSCLFAYPCFKLVPIAYRSISNCAAFMDEYWPWCRTKKKVVQVVPAKAPTAVQKKGRNKRGHVSDQKAHMFWDD